MAKEELADILNGTTGGDEPPAEAPVEAPEAAPEGRPRDEHGRFASPGQTGEQGEPQGDPAQAAPPAAEPPAQMVPLAALEDYRRKWQEEAAARQALERTLQQWQQPPQPRAEDEAPLDFWEDPNAVIGRQVNQAVNNALQGWEMKQMQREADAAEQAAKAKYPDYPEAFAKFEDQVRFDPGLIQQLANAPDKAEFAYRRGKQALDIAQAGDLDSLKANIRAELEAELRAQSPIGSPQPPTTTANQRSVGQRSGPAWSGPAKLEDLLG